MDRHPAKTSFKITKNQHKTTLTEMKITFLCGFEYILFISLLVRYEELHAQHTKQF